MSQVTESCAFSNSLHHFLAKSSTFFTRTSNMIINDFNDFNIIISIIIINNNNHNNNRQKTPETSWNKHPPTHGPFWYWWFRKKKIGVHTFADFFKVQSHQLVQEETRKQRLFGFLKLLSQTDFLALVYHLYQTSLKKWGKSPIEELPKTAAGGADWMWSAQMGASSQATQGMKPGELLPKEKIRRSEKIWSDMFYRPVFFGFVGLFQWVPRVCFLRC